MNFVIYARIEVRKPSTTYYLETQLFREKVFKKKIIQTNSHSEEQELITENQVVDEIFMRKPIII